MRSELAPEAVISALTILRAEGYEVLSLSGGEPLLYSGFETVVSHAAHLGYRVNLITNGAPVAGRLLDVIAEHVSLVAVSLDGAPQTHVELRGHPRAFVHAERAIDRLAAHGVNFGIAYCISRESLADMPWAVEFAEAKGAALIQFHPFAATERGRYLAERLALSSADLARAYLIAALLETQDGMAVQLDVTPVELAATRRNDYSMLVLEDATGTDLSDLVNPLIIDERGTLFPFTYGINEGFALGRLESGLQDVIGAFKNTWWRDLSDLLDASFKVLATIDTPFIDWYFHLIKMSNNGFRPE